MEKNTVLSGNKLIRDFMHSERKNGWYIFNTPGLPIAMCSETFTDFKFDSSWDWLMPVVEKTINLGIWYSLWTNQLHDGLLEQDRQSCFKAVVSFIENKKE